MRAATERHLGVRGTTLLAAALMAGLAATPARAQFNFFGPSEVSPQDIYDTVAEHGFRLVGPLYRNGRVYLADVIDRRQRRERLVIAAENGQIVQRFLVDLGGSGGPRGYAPPAPPRDDSFFSHLTRGWDDEPPPRPPLGLGTQGEGVLVPAPAAPPRRREPRVVTRTEGTVAPPAGVTATPLPAPAPQSTKPEVAKTPDATASTPASPPAPAGTPPASGRGTTVSTDPLRLPGTRQPEAPKPTPAAVASKAPTPAPSPAAPAPAAPPAKPTAPAPTNDVPVAPLD